MDLIYKVLLLLVALYVYNIGVMLYKHATIAAPASSDLFILCLCYVFVYHMVYIYVMYFLLVAPDSSDNAAGTI